MFAPQLLALVPLIRHECAFLVAAILFFILFQKRLLAYNLKVGQSISEKIIKNKRQIDSAFCFLALKIPCWSF